MKEEEYSSPYITPQQVFTTPSGSSNQDYLCTYRLRIEHAGMVERGRDTDIDRDRERDQG